MGTLNDCVDLMERIDKSYRDYSRLMCEGSWGYEPRTDDNALDTYGDLIGGMEDYLKEKYQSLSKKGGGEQLWRLVYSLETFLDIAETNDMWHRDDVVEILDIYDKVLTECENDKEWIEGWVKPDEMRKSLAKCRSEYERYRKIVDKEKAEWRKRTSAQPRGPLDASNTPNND